MRENEAESSIFHPSLLIVAMSLLGLIMGCFGSGDGSIAHVSVAELKAQLDKDSSLALIDVRTKEEFEAVRVPHIKARLDFQSIAETIDTLQFPKDQPLFLICRSGRRSLIAAKELREIGYKNPINVSGGTIAWDQAGYALIKR